MPLVVGIDEAGYGPLLGPLVVGATAWQVPQQAVDADWWDLLGDAISRAGKRGESHLPVGDSKKIYDRKRGLWTLERTVLAFVHATGRSATALGELLAALGCPQDAAGATFPWYRDLSRSLPTDPARSAFEGAAQRLTRVMNHTGVVCRGLRVELLTEDIYNRRVAQTRNKASVLLETVLRLIDRAGGRCGDQDLHVRVDRLGGRTDYRGPLMDAFPRRHLHVLELSETCSRYRLAARDNDWYVTFLVEGDQRHVPIALASMVAKYVRELLMECFNTYWRGLAPDLRPTAGYYQDAKRFLADIAPLVEREAIAPKRFVRAR